MSNTDRLNTALEGRYRIERHLGEGGMATVYLAADLKHDRKVALKLLKPELAAVLGADRFVQEIKTTAALQHPHILPLFDSGTVDGYLFYVMPWIQGETLRERLNRETQLGVDEAVRIAREVADALDYAHRHGVIHRDIKPENILLHDGRPMVADFGIALAVSAAAGGRMTETGLSLGTPHYMSPEQATAEKEITGRADIYSIGTVLYEMLTGNPPHTGATAQQIIMKIITDSAEPVTKYRKAVPPHVAAAIAKSLEKLPADRFESAKAFADALGNPGFTSATHYGVTGQSRASRGTLTAPFIAASAVAAIAIVVAAIGWLRPAEPRVVSRFSVLLPDSQEIAPANLVRIALSRDGRTIVYVGEGSSPGSTRLWSRPLDQLRATPLAGTENGGNPAFSPDGRRLAFTTTAPRALKVISLSGGPAITLTDSLVDLGGVSWGHDGYIYYDAHFAGDGVARIRETGGNPEIASRPDTTAGELYHNMPFALPGGRGLLITVARPGGATKSDVAVLDLKTGTLKVLGRGLSAQYVASGHIVWVTEDGVMMAAAFDPDRQALRSDPVAVLTGMAVRGVQRIDLAFAPNGSMIYVEGAAIGTARELVWVSRHGEVTPVDPTWTAPMVYRPELSPDGRRVAITRGSRPGDGQVWVKELDRGPASKIADAGILPHWSSDGRTIVFVNGGAVMSVPADGSVLPGPFMEGPRRRDVINQIALSPDGKWLAFQAQANLYARATTGDTTRHELIGVTTAIESSPEISPDGRWLAYASDETGRYEVYVRPFPDARIAKHQVSTGGGSRPRWSRDGKELFFVDDRVDLIVVPMSGGPTYAAGAPTRLFNVEPYVPGIRSFDVSPDGKRFLLSRYGGGANERPDELIVVQNFFEELRAKLKR